MGWVLYELSHRARRYKNSELGGIKRPFFFLFILNSEKEFDQKNIVFLTFDEVQVSNWSSRVI